LPKAFYQGQYGLASQSVTAAIKLKVAKQLTSTFWLLRNN